MCLQGAKLFKTWEILSTLCLRNRATPQTNASRIQMWHLSMTKHSSKQADISSQALALKRIFNCVAASRILLKAKLDQHLSAFWIRSPITRFLLSAVNKSLQDKTLVFCSLQHSLWPEQQPTICAIGSQKRESSKADSVDTKMSHGVYAVSPDCSQQLRKSYSCLFLCTMLDF